MPQAGHRRAEPLGRQPKVAEPAQHVRLDHGDKRQRRSPRRIRVDDAVNQWCRPGLAARPLPEGSAGQAEMMRRLLDREERDIEPYVLAQGTSSALTITS